jgi:hypothetical protein
MAILADQDRNKKKGNAPDTPGTGAAKRQATKSVKAESDLKAESKSKTDKKK